MPSLEINRQKIELSIILALKVQDLLLGNCMFVLRYSNRTVIAFIEVTGKAEPVYQKALTRD